MFCILCAPGISRNVIPAHTGIQLSVCVVKTNKVDPRFRGGDNGQENKNARSVERAFGARREFDKLKNPSPYPLPLLRMGEGEDSILVVFVTPSGRPLLGQILLLIFLLRDFRRVQVTVRARGGMAMGRAVFVHVNA